MKLLLFTTFILGLLSLIQCQTCPLRCPACTRCDPKKGTCSLARDFVTCTRSGVSGVCFAGACNTKINLPATLASNRCQTYSCPQNGACAVITAPDGTDCTPTNAVGYESICLTGVCNRIWLGITDEMPHQNIGCIGKPNGATCDTNHVYTDGEKCLNNVCRFPDGTFYGYLPA